MLLAALLGGLCGQFSLPADTEWAETVGEAMVVAESSVAEAQGQIASEDFAEVSAEVFEELGGLPSSLPGDRYFYVARVGVFGAYENQDLVAQGARFLFDIDTLGNGYVGSAVMGDATSVQPVLILLETRTRLVSLQSTCTGIL